MLAQYVEGDGWVLEMFPEIESPDVTHWMPLPEMPKEATHIRPDLQRTLKDQMDITHNHLIQADTGRSLSLLQEIILYAQMTAQQAKVCVKQ